MGRPNLRTDTPKQKFWSAPKHQTKFRGQLDQSRNACPSLNKPSKHKGSGAFKWAGRTIKCKNWCARSNKKLRERKIQLKIIWKWRQRLGYPSQGVDKTWKASCIERYIWNTTKSQHRWDPRLQRFDVPGRRSYVISYNRSDQKWQKSLSQKRLNCRRSWSNYFNHQGLSIFDEI